MTTQDRPFLLKYDGAQRRSSATRETVPKLISRQVGFQVTEKKVAFFMRGPTWCRKKAAEIGPACAELIAGLLIENALYRLRAAQGVLGLADKHNPARLEAACAKALAVGDPTYKTVKGILAAGTEDLPVHEPTGDAGAAAFLHGPDQLFGNVVALPTTSASNETAPVTTTATTTTTIAEDEAS